MRKAPWLITLTVVAVSPTGCASDEPSATQPTATAAALVPAAIGDGGRIAVALRAGSGADEIVYRHQQAGDTWSLRIVSLETGQSRTLPIGEPGTPLAPAWQARMNSGRFSR